MTDSSVKEVIVAPVHEYQSQYIVDPSSRTPIKKSSRNLSQRNEQKLQQEYIHRRTHARLTNKLRLNAKTIMDPYLKKNIVISIEDYASNKTLS